MQFMNYNQQQPDQLELQRQGEKCLWHETDYQNEFGSLTGLIIVAIVNLQAF